MPVGAPGSGAARPLPHRAGQGCSRLPARLDAPASHPLLASRGRPPVRRVPAGEGEDEPGGSPRSAGAPGLASLSPGPSAALRRQPPRCLFSGMRCFGNKKKVRLLYDFARCGA
uniref:Uncharacterized protein n=1 Tax=Sphaerodactylus townsendi TaxID=933632 RepID=A0ACB8F5Z4_9SAUR